MLNRKPYIESHRKDAEEKLAVRLDLLKTNGLDDKQIQKDAKVKHYRAEIRQARHQLAGIAAIEELTSEKTAAKAQKEAAAKASRQESKKAAKAAAPKKPKKEKRAAAPKTE